jgi:hypothetical protein
MDRYDKLNQILSHLFYTFGWDKTRSSTTFCVKRIPTTWKVSSYIFDPDLNLKLAKELKKIDHVYDTVIPLGFNPEDTLKVELTIRGTTATITYIFKLTPLTSYEKLTQLDKSFDMTKPQI